MSLSVLHSGEGPRSRRYGRTAAMRVIVQKRATYLVHHIFYLFTVVVFGMGRDSLVDIATRYGLNGSGFEPQWGRDFPHRP
jgi:hypothetical protein